MNYLLRAAGLLLVFVTLMLPAQAQNIATIAGTGTLGFSGDGGPAVSAQLRFPAGVAVDGAGNVYIADGNNERIRKIAAGTGVITSIAGMTGGSSADSIAATSAQLSFPYALALDGSGNLYFADEGESWVRKINLTTGIITTVAGTGGSGFGGDGGPAKNAMFFLPHGVAVDGAGNVYISDYNNRIHKVTAATGIITSIAGTGLPGYSGDNGPATSAQISNPNGVLVDGAGNIWFSDGGNNRVRRIAAATGIITTVAGTGSSGSSGDGGAATSAQLSNPDGLALDGAGNLYIADHGGYRIRKVNAATGIITTIAGTGINGYSGDGGASTSARLNSPTDVAIDGSGNMYIADYANCRVRKVSAASPTGVVNMHEGWVGTLSVYPSPGNGRFTIAALPGAGHGSEQVQITVLNSIGQTVYSREFIASGVQWTIPVQLGTDVGDGVYKVCVCAAGVSVVRTVVVAR